MHIPFVRLDEGNKMTIVGTPTLSNIKVIMVGVRNPRKTFVTPNDDGLPKSAEVWVNELRLYDFEDQGGWAANAHASMPPWPTWETSAWLRLHQHTRIWKHRTKSKSTAKRTDDHLRCRHQPATRTLLPRRLRGDVSPCTSAYLNHSATPSTTH
jgi:hypothetical protein